MEQARFFESQKYMWDNIQYPDATAAKTAADAYETEGFKVRIVEEDEGAFVYSRRVAAEVVVEE